MRQQTMNNQPRGKKMSKITIRQIIKSEVEHKAGVICKYNTKRVYGEVIAGIWRTAYARLAKEHPQMEWLKVLASTPSKDISIKMYLRIPDKDIEIDLPSTDAKLSAVAHGGGADLLSELLNIIKTIGITDE